MAKKLISCAEPPDLVIGGPTNDDAPPSPGSPLPEYDLVGDVVFDPPLSPEERRLIYGPEMSTGERLARARRQIAEGLDQG